MKIVLLSGGSGKRLWPLSNETRSKQFLKLLKNPDGNYESMVQRVYRQIKAVDPDGSIVIATSRSQMDSIRNQLGQTVDVVLEPERRNTFPAIALACSYLRYTKKVDLDEPIIVLPVDPYVDLEYFERLKLLEQGCRELPGELMLMGVKPTYPSAKYGYIIPHRGSVDHMPWYPVECFKEKPTETQAQELIEQGAFWNCGVFAFRISFIMDILGRQININSFEDLLCRYDELNAESFDYEVVEKCKNVSVVAYDGIWNDLGTWNTLTEHMPEATIGSIMIDDKTQQSHIINELDIPIVVMGAKNMVVVASYDGILVADKGQSSYLKPFAEAIMQRPMFVERWWGDYRVIDYGIHTDGTKYLVKKILIKEGKSISYQIHSLRSEYWTITEGEGIILLDGVRREIRKGETLIVMPEQKHAIRAVTDLEILEIQMGKEVDEDDIERLELEW